MDFADITDGDEQQYFRKTFPMHAYRTDKGERMSVSVIASIVRVNLEEPVWAPCSSAQESGGGQRSRRPPA